VTHRDRQRGDLCCMWSSCGVHKSVSSVDCWCCSKCRLRDAVTTSDTDTVSVSSLDCFCHYTQTTQ